MHTRLPWLLLLTLAVTGCGKLTAENYDKLKVGMSYAEVKSILGEPDRCSDVLGAKQCRWGDDSKYIQVNFVADQVLLYNAENVR